MSVGWPPGGSSSGATPLGWPFSPDPDLDVSRETHPASDVSRETALAEHEHTAAEGAGDTEAGTVSRETDADRPQEGATPAVSPDRAADDAELPEVADASEADLASGNSPTAGDNGPPAAEAPATPEVPAQWPRPSGPRILGVANQKGGVGKTTSTVNLAAALAQHGARVLVVDLDPQGNASTAFNVTHTEGTPSIYDVLVHGRPIEEVTAAVDGMPTLACAPATIDLAGAEIELVSMVARETRLARALAVVAGDYDYIFIDCPPSLGLLTVNALVAAREVLIPIQCEFYALEGLSQLLRNIELVRAHLNPELHVSTIVLTMYDGRTRLAEQVADEVRGHFGATVLTSAIPRSVRISEAPGFGQTVMTYDPSSRGARAYAAAAYEIAARESTDQAAARISTEPAAARASTEPAPSPSREGASS